MATLQSFTQDPDAKLDYSIDWTNWLAIDDEIQTTSWVVTPTGPTLSGNSLNVAKKITTIWFDGGTLGSKYVLTNSIVTADGREDDRSITIKIAQR